MSRRSDWRSLPVWRCSELDVCGAQWATSEEGTTCPFCHCRTGQSTGFTCGELQEAAERYGFGGDLPVHIPEPVPDLVQLVTLPRRAWIGLPVFHPCAQDGTNANWLSYDVGVVLEVCPDPDSPRELQCRFVTSVLGRSATLHYGPDNLWVPRVLAERLG
jgi:hypothetical protein